MNLSRFRSAALLVGALLLTFSAVGQDAPDECLTLDSDLRSSWRVPLPDATEVTGTDAITTTSLTAVLAAGMSVTPAAGTYLVMFTTYVSSDSVVGQIATEIFCFGVGRAPSIRVSENQFGTGHEVPHASVSTCAVDGTQPIEGRWRVSAGTGTMRERSLVVLRVQ